MRIPAAVAIVAISLLGSGDAWVRSAAAQSVETETRPITVGILREDSILIPFARFDGRRWRQTWPPADAIDVVPELAKLPSTWWAGGTPALRWELLRLDGTRRRVTVRRAVKYEADYGAGAGLETDYATPLRFGEKTWPQERRETAGAAGTRRNALQPIVPVEKTGREFRDIMAALPGIFAKAEPAVWQQVSRASEALRAQGRPQPIIRAAYAAPLPDGRQILVAHARNSVRGLGVTSLHAWFVSDGSTITSVHADVSVSDEDGKSLTTLVPLAALTEAGRTFWIGKECAYEGGGFVVLEVGSLKPTMVAHMDVAGC